MDYEQMARDLARALRGRRSQTAMSRRLGFKTNVAYTWESGRRWPTASTFLRAAAKLGVDVGGAIERFYGAKPAWASACDPASPEGVAALLGDLRGQTPIVDLAARTGRSRYAIARWLGGEAEPRLPDFFRVVEAASLRLLDLVATLVDPAVLPSARAAWERLVAHRRAAFDLPWVPAVLRALELADYRNAGKHRRGWIAERLGIDVAEEDRCLETLARSGQIRRVRGRWAPEREIAVDVRPDPEATLRLKAWWAEVGLQRLRAGAPGQFSFNVFSVSRADLDRLRELHLGYFRALRAIVAASAPGEHVAVANVQLFSLAGDWP